MHREAARQALILLYRVVEPITNQELFGALATTNRELSGLCP